MKSKTLSFYKKQVYRAFMDMMKARHDKLHFFDVLVSIYLKYISMSPAARSLLCVYKEMIEAHFKPSKPFAFTKKESAMMRKFIRDGRK
jgi:hypothetical protein